MQTHESWSRVGGDYVPRLGVSLFVDLRSCGAELPYFLWRFDVYSGSLFDGNDSASDSETDQIRLSVKIKLVNQV